MKSVKVLVYQRTTRGGAGAARTGLTTFARGDAGHSRGAAARWPREARTAVLGRHANPGSLAEGGVFAQIRPGGASAGAVEK